MFFAPKQVLTRYYWSPQKRKEFWSAILVSKSQKHFGALLSNIKLNEHLSLPIEISEIDDHNIIVPKLEEMDGTQLYHLLRLYEISPFSGITKLKERSLLIHCLDKKLISENNNTIDSMDESEVITQLYIRRIMFTSDEDINILRERLKTWVKYSGQFYENGNEGLLLYVPVITQGIRNTL
uniref:LETM1 domain-containing protein n=1 Tax=Strongyloides venezuelensis TaxID=75913 RepID=A0A0K0F835_STRVS